MTRITASSIKGKISESYLGRLFGRASLDSKLVISLIIVGMLGFAALLAALTATIMPSFAELEAKEAQNHIQRTRAAFDEYSMRVHTTVKDYGAWDDSFNYLKAPSRKFEEETFSVLAMSNLDVNGMAYVEFEGKIPFSRWIDLKTQTEMPSLGRDFDRLLMALAKHPQRQKEMRFYARFGDRIAAISATPVVRTDGSGTPIGLVAMARTLDSAQLSALIQLKARLSLADRKPAPLLTIGDDRLEIAVDIKGLDHRRVGQAKFTVERDLFGLGQRALLLAVLSSVLVLIFTLFAMRALVKRIVIAPMRMVERHMQQVSMAGDLQVLHGIQSEDEIGSLALSLNSMMRQLKDLREQLEIQSFKLGRTESAVGVMHNVRNGLNPVSVIISKLITSGPVASIADTKQALAELGDPRISEDRRAKLSTFLQLALSTEEAERNNQRSDLRAARICLANVVELIGKQQANAHEKIDTEAYDIADIIRQNAALAQYSEVKQVRFVVDEGRYTGSVNRVLFSQVIGNVLANAIESIVSAKREMGLIEVRFFHEADRLEVHIRDNGEGFATERGKQLFERGYSSRKQKSGGLGLHWCANAMSLMSGRLTLGSDGEGLGATAILTLPKSDPTETVQIEDRGAQARDRGNAPEVRAREIQNRR